MCTLLDLTCLSSSTSWLSRIDLARIECSRKRVGVVTGVRHGSSSPPDVRMISWISFGRSPSLRTRSSLSTLRSSASVRKKCRARCIVRLRGWGKKTRRGCCPTHRTRYLLLRLDCARYISQCLPVLVRFRMSLGEFLGSYIVAGNGACSNSG